MGTPDGKAVLIEFVVGTWTDVTDYVDWSASLTVQFGRTSPFSQAQAATLGLTLDNTDGRFTPFKQVLADGVTPHPYWPNVKPLKRIRFTVTMGATTTNVYTGYVWGWPPGVKDPARPRVAIEARDRLALLANVIMQQPLPIKVLADDPTYYWPMSDPSGSATAAEQVSGNGANAMFLLNPSFSALSFGSTGPGLGVNGTAVTLSPDGSDSAETLGATVRAFDVSGGWTFEAWVNPASIQVGAGTFLFLASSSVAAFLQLSLNPDGSVHIDLPNGGTLDGSTSLFPGGFHLVVLTWFPATDRFTLYIDGVQDVTQAGVGWVGAPQLLELGNPFPGDFMNGSIGHMALYGSLLSTTRQAAHLDAGRGFVGDTVDERIIRYLTYAGLTAVDWNVDSSNVSMGVVLQDGVDVLAACQSAVDTEGGGAALYVGPAGTVTFVNQDSRKAAAPDLVIDNEADMDGTQWQPAYDADTLVNSVTVNRTDSTGTQTSQTVTDATSVTNFGPQSEQFTSYAQRDVDALLAAQYRLAGRSKPGYRVSQVAIDLWTGSADYIDVANLRVGDRIRLENLPPTQPASSVDLLIEGGTITVSDSQYTVVFDTSPADNPAGAIWGDATYGLWGTKGQTLSSGITAAATSLSVVTSAGNPTFTTSAGAYPLTVQIGAEQITLNNPPGGSSSPQTFTGVTRGVNGTPAAAQTSGRAVTLYPVATWAI